MPVDDTSFYNIVGEEISRTTIVQKMIDFYQSLLQAGETRVTDFNEGSEIRNLLESFAVDNYDLRDEQNKLSQIAFIETADGEWLDKHGAKPEIDQPRDTGAYAEGVVDFTLPEAVEVETIIPAEILLTCEDNGLDYLTETEVVIGVGETTGSTMATCTVVGTEGNCDANSLNIISDDDLDLYGITVNNSENFTGGMDYEEDDDYRRRLLEYRQRNDFGSLPYYMDICEEVEGVHDVYLVDDLTYTANVLVNGDTKPTPDTVLSDVLEVMTRVTNIVWGHSFTVSRPNYVKLKFTLTLSVAEEIDDEDIEGLLQDLFDGGGHLEGMDLEGLSIGEGLSRNQFEGTLELIEDIIGIGATYQVYEDGSWSESANFNGITIEEDEVLQLDSVSITQTVIT